VRDAAIAVKIVFILSGANADEVEAMIRMAEELDISYVLDAHMMARHDGSRSSLALSLDGASLERLYRGPLAQYAVGGGTAPRRIACPCARSVCGIGSSGDVYPCIGAPLAAGNLRTSSFRDIWRNSPTLHWVRGLRNEDFHACASCAHLPYCRRSSGIMLNNTRNFTGPAQFGDDLCCVEAEVVHRLVDENHAAELTASSYQPATSAN